MKTINATTKKGTALFNAYNNSTDYELRDCYGRYSTEKSRADYFCRERMRAESGHGYKIISFNTFGFSCAWLVADGLRVETASNSYLVKC